MIRIYIYIYICTHTYFGVGLLLVLCASCVRPTLQKVENPLFSRIIPGKLVFYLYMFFLNIVCFQCLNLLGVLASFLVYLYHGLSISPTGSDDQVGE